MAMSLEMKGYKQIANLLSDMRFNDAAFVTILSQDRVMRRRFFNLLVTYIKIISVHYTHANWENESERQFLKMVHRIHQVILESESE